MFLVHLNSFNDIDHMTPVIYRLLQRQVQVHIIFRSGSDFQEDYRIRLLRRFSNLSVSHATKFDRIRNKLISNHIARRFRNVAVLGGLIRVFARWVWPNRFVSSQSVRVGIFEWGGPGMLNFYDLIDAGVPTICLPHGMNIFTNDDVNDVVRQIIVRTGALPDNSQNDMYARYVVQTQRHADYLLRSGQKLDNIRVLGSARFDAQWCVSNREADTEFQPKTVDDEKLKIVFFLPHWAYNVDVEACQTLLTSIAQLDDCYLVVKGHTRGSGSASGAWADALAKRPFVEVNTPANSPSLIAWADISLGFGSSITLESLQQGKPSIHLPFLHTNKTVFDDGKVVHVAKTVKDVFALIEAARCGALPTLSADAKMAFLSENVYANRAAHDVLDSYSDEIMAVAKDS